MMNSEKEKSGEQQITYVIRHEYKHEEEGNKNCRAIQSSPQDSRGKRNGRSEQGVNLTY